EAAVADGLPRRPRQAVGLCELALLALAQNERAREARLHGVEVAELAPADLVHPDPFPGGAHEHHLLGNMPEGAHAFARPLEPLGGAQRQILERRFGLGTLARAGVEIGRPVARRLVVDGDNSVLIVNRWSSSGSARRRATGRSPRLTPPCARPCSCSA